MDTQNSATGSRAQTQDRIGQLPDSDPECSGEMEGRKVARFEQRYSTTLVSCQSSKQGT